MGHVVDSKKQSTVEVLLLIIFLLSILFRYLDTGITSTEKVDSVLNFAQKNLSSMRRKMDWVYSRS